MIVTFHAGTDTGRGPLLAALTGRYLSEKLGKTVFMLDVAWDLPMLHHEFGRSAEGKQDDQRPHFLAREIPDEIIAKSTESALLRVSLPDQSHTKPYHQRAESGGFLFLFPVVRFKDQFDILDLPAFQRFCSLLKERADFVLISDRSGNMTASGEVAAALSDMTIAIAEPSRNSQRLVLDYINSLGFGRKAELIETVPEGAEEKAVYFEDLREELAKEDIQITGMLKDLPVIAVPGDEDVTADSFSLDEASPLMEAVRKIAERLVKADSPEPPRPPGLKP